MSWRAVILALALLGSAAHAQDVRFGPLGPTASAPSGQLPGTATNDNACTGCVGEYITATVAQGSAVALTTGTAATVTSISLTAGDWDAWGTVAFIPGATTTVVSIIGGIANNPATFPANGTNGLAVLNTTLTTGFGQQLDLSSVRLSLAAPATIYLTAQSTFGTSTMGAFGTISARRRR